MIALLAFGSVALACALLSLVVVNRKWAFISEGIGHSGLGGAGTAWILMAMFPALVNQNWITEIFIVLGALTAAMCMGILSRKNWLSMDASIGIFLVATVAWGFIGRQIYIDKRHTEPAGFDTILFGKPEMISTSYAMVCVCIAMFVVITLVSLRKEIIAYCVDPLLAETSGVRVGLIHHLLIVLMALTTIVGLQIVGSLLVTALLVLPGASAMLLSRKLPMAILISISIALIGAASGFIAHEMKSAIPVGPAMVLAMFGLFLIAMISKKIAR
ncbi:MAG TPA: metal ABC transporter permease [Tepidisphaeraceae bacterium]|nr:metal ABC transporter permease [Tepidisphaeraceae bacterium]